MNIKRTLAAVLAAAIMNVSSVTALAATDTKRIEPGDARPMWGQRHVDRFERLLEAGVITQSTYNKIKLFLDENMPQDPVRPERWNTLDRLLQAGIITQAEHDSLKSAMASPTKMPDGLEKTRQTNPYSRFVADGLISEETATAIMEYLMANRPQKSKRVDMLSKMLDSGVITQEEYDDIKANMPDRPAKIYADGVMAG